MTDDFIQRLIQLALVYLLLTALFVMSLLSAFVAVQLMQYFGWSP